MEDIKVKQLNEILAAIRKNKNVKDNVDLQVKTMVYKMTQERKKQNITQDELSDMTGIPQTTISRIESFVSTPTLPILINIANALQLKITLTKIQKL